MGSGRRRRREWSLTDLDRCRRLGRGPPSRWGGSHRRSGGPQSRQAGEGPAWRQAGGARLRLGRRPIGLFRKIDTHARCVGIGRLDDLDHARATARPPSPFSTTGVPTGKGSGMTTKTPDAVASRSSAVRPNTTPAYLTSVTPSIPITVHLEFTPATTSFYPRSPRMLTEGKNCWRVVDLRRAPAFLSMPTSTSRAFAARGPRARARVVSRVGHHQAEGAGAACSPGRCRTAGPSTLREYLNAALGARPDLHAYLLDWDFSLVFALERELLPVVKLGWLSHPRLHFSLDAEHPLTGCHHQKIVVVDDAVAFVGGLDLTTSRWDTPDHRVDDPPPAAHRQAVRAVPRRADHGLGRCRASLATARARALGTRDRHVSPSSVTSDPWPRDLVPDLRDVEVAIARTDPAWTAGRRLPRSRALSRLDRGRAPLDLHREPVLHVAAASRRRWRSDWPSRTGPRS